jgi:hypothetical protein
VQVSRVCSLRVWSLGVRVDTRQACRSRRKPPRTCARSAFVFGGEGLWGMVQGPTASSSPPLQPPPRCSLSLSLSRARSLSLSHTHTHTHSISFDVSVFCAVSVPVSISVSLALSLGPRSAVESRGNYVKGAGYFYLKAYARIWP